MAASGAIERDEIQVAIEVPHGPVVETLMEREFKVHSINPKQGRHSAGAREHVAPQIVSCLPVEEETDIARHAAGEIDDHRLQLVALRLAEGLIALVELLGLASVCGQSRPALLIARPLSVQSEDGKL